MEGHAVGHVEGFRFVPDPVAEGPEKRMVLRAARRALRAPGPGRVAALEAAPDAALGWDGEHRLSWDGVAVGRLRLGPSLLQPAVEALDSEYLDGPSRERVRARLERFVRGRVAADLAPLFAVAQAADKEPALRGHVHRVLEAGGVVAGATEADVEPVLRGRLKAVGVRAGRFALFVPAMLKPRAAGVRAALLALRRGVACPALPGNGWSAGPWADCLGAPRARSSRRSRGTWVGWRRGRPGCGWMWRSGWPRSWRSPRGALGSWCRRTWLPGSACPRACFRPCCGRWACG